MCQNYSTKGVPWSKGDCRPCNPDSIHLKRKRAFHQMVVVEKANGEELMLALGGYNGQEFLDSFEKYIPEENKWEVVTTMKLNESRSHFCAVFYKVTKSLSHVFRAFTDIYINVDIEI